MALDINNARFDHNDDNQLIHRGNTYSGDPYSDLRNADPYANFDYNIGPFEDFFRHLGFRTSYDKYREQMQLASNAYQADVSQKQYDEAYNSPAAQAARMRAAGLNPDLLGTGDVESASTMSSEDNPLADVPGADVGSGDATRDPMAFGNMILSAISMAFGFSKDIGAINQIRLANETGQVSIAQDLMKLAKETIINYSPAVKEIDSTDNGLVVYDPTSLVNRVADRYKGVLSKRRYRQFVDDLTNMIDSLGVEAEQYKLGSERIDSRKGYFLKRGDSNYSESDEVMYGIGMELGHLSGEIERLKYQNEKSSAQLESEKISNEMEYQQALDPSAVAESENASARYNTIQKQAQGKIEASFNRIMDYLEKKSERGNHLASVALSILGAFRLMSVSSIPTPSVSFSHKF